MAIPGTPYFNGTKLHDLCFVRNPVNVGQLATGASWTKQNKRKGGFGALSFSNSGATVAAWNLGSSAITVMCWLYSADYDVDAAFITHDAVADFFLRSDAFGGGISMSGTGTAASGPVPTGGRWLHVCGTIGSGSGYLYYDGVQVAASEGLSIAIANNTNTLFIGRQNGSGYAFNGLMDDIRIFKTALSAKAINRIIEDSKRGSPDALRWQESRAWLFGAAAGATYTPTLADTGTFSDSLARAVILGRTTNDTGTFTDALTRLATLLRIVSDSPLFSESLIAFKIAARTLTDTGTFTDSVSRAGAFARTAVDTSTLSDSIARIAMMPRTSSDTGTFSDSLVRVFAGMRPLADAGTFTDTVTRALVLGRMVSDIGTFSDSIAAVKVVTRTLTDTAAFSDSLTHTIAFTSNIIDDGDTGYSETGVWLDSTPGYDGEHRYAPSTGGVATATATWQWVSLPSGTYEVSSTWADFSNHLTNQAFRIYDDTLLLATVTVDETSAPSGTTYNGSIFQVLGNYTITSGTLKVITDNANGTTIPQTYTTADAVRIAAAQLVTATLSDSPTFTDSLARVFIGARIASDTGTFSDTVVRIGLFSRTSVDTGTFSDSISILKSAVRSLTDAGTFADSLTRSFSGARTANDTAAFTDSIAADIQHAGTITRTAADSLMLTDSLTRAGVFVRSLNDSLSLSDSVARAQALARTANDTTIFTDNLVIQKDIGRTAVDSLVIQSPLIRLYSGLRSLIDTLQLVDTLTIPVGTTVSIIDLVNIGFQRAELINLAFTHEELIKHGFNHTEVISYE